MNRLSGKTALITGAGSGIGRVIAHTFGKEGAAVVCADIKGFEETAKEVRDAGGKAIGVELDVSKLDSWKKAVDLAVKEFGGIHALANVAGISEAVDIIDLEEKDFDKMMNVNLKGVFFGMKTVLPHFVENGSGKIVNIASLAAHVGLTGLPSYSASKGGVVSMSRQVAMQYAGRNIQVNAVSPGIIETPILANNPPEVTKQFTDATPANRLGRPDEIASMVLFLCSDESDFITGQAMIVDGGWGSQ
ncbi:SDR family NAD(P)-dependent oxidoreductase [Salisediminibacterium halotolerans]|uniref:SDR family NAD(P)-dependent oxidoreductase n=1 Tax=Salisediminibacterium halotolerans TaxID=517425 RepID=UPI000EB17B2C|nr:SDR family oxidoreductase [Salisediminibacterium halotolerans]RLJ78279.1 NAD(P)-dependent dehydrogenase (short-subunit alcohol dehydrogenase family) [Actinophytocola xinjiangensis]RPE88382.1 NAD(P)-dependent dehydrogenase (short-subunit alcohol dehydrogenase family) [Salisediminibacterium halotolerans]TWG37256.1 NAD(P)-dependent dehydrogenase (short-subunit alcohol dehydrogenase family) [Salisediminibacterium halotolerans]GEL07735.1 3-oxoacyl-[acyl-carrier-protein] reductase FabG [Salisedimi